MKSLKDLVKEHHQNWIDRTDFGNPLREAWEISLRTLLAELRKELVKDVKAIMDNDWTPEKKLEIILYSLKNVRPENRG